MVQEQYRVVGDLSGKDQTRDDDIWNADAPEGIAPMILDLCIVTFPEMPIIYDPRVTQVRRAQDAESYTICRTMCMRFFFSAPQTCWGRSDRCPSLVGCYTSPPLTIVS